MGGMCVKKALSENNILPARLHIVTAREDCNPRSVLCHCLGRTCWKTGQACKRLRVSCIVGT